MSLSASQKKLRHKLKNGVNFDPRNHRGSFGVIDGTSKRTATLTEKKRRQENKHKGKRGYDRDSSDHTFYYVVL